MVERFHTRFSRKKQGPPKCSTCGDICDKGIRIDWQKGNNIVGIFCSFECQEQGEALYTKGSLPDIDDFSSSDADTIDPFRDADESNN